MGMDLRSTLPPPADDTEPQRLRAKASELRVMATAMLKDAAGYERMAARLEKEARSCGLAEK